MVERHVALPARRYHGRHLVGVNATHLRVIVKDAAPWTIRMSPASTAVPLTAEWHGTGDEILFWDGGPAEAGLVRSRWLVGVVAGRIKGLT